MAEKLPAQTSSPKSDVSWGTIAAVTCAIVIWLLPTPDGMQPEGKRLVAVTVIMAGLWVTQRIPLAATSLLPLVLFPILGIQTARDVSSSYINDKVFLYIGGFVIALGIERWDLHRRIALTIVRYVGVSPRRLVLGFLIATGGLSMWISNTATSLLMLPIALALLKTLDDEQTNGLAADHVAANDSSKLLSTSLAVPLLLAIAYSASIGGLTTIIGTPTNNQAVGIYRDLFPDNPDISVAQWMIACIPIGVLYVAVTWYVLTRGLPRSTKHDAALKAELKNRLVRLGPASVAERRMFAVFVLTALLWVFRRPLILGDVSVLPGWSQLSLWWMNMLSVSEDVEVTQKWAESFITDSTISVMMAVVLFWIPSGTLDKRGRRQPLMDWQTAEKLPWDIMLLFGGGFALAGAFRTTQLSEWLGNALQGPLSQLPMWLDIALVCLLMTFLTEFTSNVATVSTLLPTLCAMCVALEIDPRLLIVPATLATSCAFMLPIATPPNAIVFGSGRIQVKEMVRYGILLNLIGVPILTAGTYLLIRPLMGIQ